MEKEVATVVENAMELERLQKLDEFLRVLYQPEIVREVTENDLKMAAINLKKYRIDSICSCVTLTFILGGFGYLVYKAITLDQPSYTVKATTEEEVKDEQQTVNNEPVGN